MVLAASLNSSIHKINHSAIQGLGQITASARGGTQYTLTHSQNAKILAALRAPARNASVRGRKRPEVLSPGIPALSPGGGRIHHRRLAWASDAAVAGLRLRWRPGVAGLEPDHRALVPRPHEVDTNTALLTATGRKVGGRITLDVNGKPVTVRIAGEVFTPTPVPTLFTSWQALGGAAAGLAVSHYDMALKPGTSTGEYCGSLTRALGSYRAVSQPPAHRRAPRR